MASPIGKYLHYLIFTWIENNSLSMLIKAKIIRRSCNMENPRHVFTNFNFENDLSQLAQLTML